MAKVKVKLFPKMKLLNQNRSRLAFENPATPGSENIQYQYNQNEFACAAVASAMVIRSVIEHSKGRFSNLKAKPGDVNALVNLTLTLHPPVDDATLIDTYDVALLEHLANFMGYVDFKGVPTPKASPTKDRDIKTGLGAGLAGRKNEFKSAVQPGGDVFAVRRNQFPIPGSGPGHFASFPIVRDSDLKNFLDNGVGVVIAFDFYRAVNAFGKEQLDKNGNRIWHQSGVAHALALNGYLEHPEHGLMFRVFDPFGIAPRTSRVVFPKVFAGAEFGLIEYVKFVHDHVETTFMEPALDRNAAPISVTTSNTPTKNPGEVSYGAPVWIINPFGLPLTSTKFIARPVTSFTVLVLNTDHEPLTEVELEEDELFGTSESVPEPGFQSPQAPPMTFVQFLPKIHKSAPQVVPAKTVPVHFHSPIRIPGKG